MTPQEERRLNRKLRSQARLKAEGVPFIEHLPMIEAEGEVKPHSQDEVVERALCLCLVALKGEGLEQDTVLHILNLFAIEPHLSPLEKQFIFHTNPTEHERTQFVWRYETYWVMLWALGFVEELNRPENICDVPRAVLIMKDLGADGFRAAAKLRPESEIFDEADLIYRYHWAVRDAQLNNREWPAGLNGDVVMERHYALNWLIWGEAEWDDVDTST